MLQLSITDLAGKAIRKSFMGKQLCAMVYPRCKGYGHPIIIGNPLVAHCKFLLISTNGGMIIPQSSGHPLTSISPENSPEW